MQTLKEYYIKDIATIKSGKRLPKGHSLVDFTTKYPYIKGRDIRNGKIRQDQLQYLTEDTQKKIKRYIVEMNDVCITIVANIGDVGIVPSSLNGVNLTENAIRLTKIKDFVSPQFLCQLLSAKFFKEHMELLAAGAAQSKLGIYKIEKIKVLLPPLATQQRIASILSAYDDLIEVNNQRIKILEETARELYKEWFVRMRFPGYKKAKFVKGVPEGWEVKSVSDIADVTSSKRIFLSDYVSEGIPFYRGKEISIKSNNGEVSDILYITKTKFAEIKKRFGVPDIGDILITAVGTIGNIYLVNETDGDFYFKDGNLIWLRKFKTKELSFYFYYYSISDVFTNSLNSITIGSSQEALTIASLKKIKLFLPTQDLIYKFYQMTEPIKTQTSIIQQQNTQLRQIRDRLLPRLISGKLEVQELLTQTKGKV